MSISDLIPVGARKLGVRVAPQLRLAMGYRDEQKKGAPVKTDHFIAKLGSEGEHRRQAEKFYEVYGDEPKAVDILLPPELHHALLIQYKAWGSSGDDEGGVLKAIGHTNFALEEYVGGTDMLTVWNPDGTVVEVETAGLDAQTGEPLDETAANLGLALYTTFRFMLPRVLGFGSFAEITSKGKKTTDNLWSKTQLYYGMFGAKVTMAIQPQLVIRPATARPTVTTKEGPRRIKSSIYVLDLVLPESQDEMLARLEKWRHAVGELGGPADALYGPQQPDGPRELEKGSAVPIPGAAADEASVIQEADADGAGGVADSSTAAAPTVDTDPEPGGEEEPGQQLGFSPPTVEAQELQRQAAAAGLSYIEGGNHAGQTIADFHESKPKIAVSWFRWILKRPTHPNYGAVAAYARVYAPEALEAGD